MNTLIEIYNIQKIGDIISADVRTIEPNPYYFKVSVNIKTKEKIECTSEHHTMFEAGAVRNLFKIYDEYGDNFPEKYQVAFY